jgi:hypothetical protein
VVDPAQLPAQLGPSLRKLLFGAIWRSGEGEAGVEVEFEDAVGVDVDVGERREAPPVDVVERDGSAVVIEDFLDHERVDFCRVSSFSRQT